MVFVMKILLIGPGKLKYMPYAHFYLDNIDCRENEVHLTYWNRDEKEEDSSSFPDITLHEYRCCMEDSAPLKEKAQKFYRYRKMCKALINQQKFDYIIVLHSLSGLMIYDILKKQYQGRFILDYRDSTYEPRWGFFRKAVGNLIRFSKAAFTSSDGFREYFPDDCQKKIITSHNLLEDSLLHRDYQKNGSDNIRIAFWGFIRHPEINKYLQDRIGNDSRFELHYYGREQADAIVLKEYAAQQGYKNIFFHGEYKPADRYEFVKNTDMIHNIYLDVNTLRAMGNKYYDGIIFRIPQICFPGSQMSKMCEYAGVGVSLDPRNEDFCDRLYDYYRSPQSSFIANCDKELERILEEYSRGKQIISEIFGPNKK